MITDQPERQLCAEMIREKMLLSLQSEVPHGVAIEISRFLVRDDGITEIDATIYCEKDSHKGIIIGKNGEMLKKIGELARADMEKMLDSKVFLQTWVKVKPNWRDSGANLRTFGYSE
jgi:GTP-binding protein Era